MKDSIINTKNTNNMTVLNHPSSTSDGTNADDLGSKCDNNLIKPSKNDSAVRTKNETESVVSFKIPNELNNKLKETSNNNRLTESDYQLADSKLYKTPLIAKIKLPNSISIEKLKSIDQLLTNQTIQTKQFLIEKEMGEIAFDHSSLNFEGELTENAIKQVVEQCFDQLSKNNKITSACLSLSMGKLKENEAITNDVSNSKEALKNARNALVEKLDVLNEPTNTILLSSKNDVNELYSLKITFV